MPLSITQNKDDRVLRLPEVVNLTGLSKSGVYQAIQDNDFPKPLKLGKRASGWLSSEVSGWITNIAAKREVA